MTLVDGFNFGASVASIILAVLAIWMSLYFYNQSKNTESRVQIALEGIRSQTEALQTLSSKQMDRLTKFVTTPRTEMPAELQQVISALERLPDNIIERLPTPQVSAGQEELVTELINSYIVIYYYTAVANVFAGFNLPPPDKFDPANQFHNLTKDVVDQSARDFTVMAQRLVQVDQTRLNASTLRGFLHQARDFYRKHVRDTAGHFAARARSEHEDEV